MTVSVVLLHSLQVEWLERMTSNPVFSLAWYDPLGDALIAWHGGKESSTGSFQER